VESGECTHASTAGSATGPCGDVMAFCSSWVWPCCATGASTLSWPCGLQLRGSLSRLEEEKEELETQREAVLSELQSVYTKLDTTAESKEKYKRRCVCQPAGARFDLPPPRSVVRDAHAPLLRSYLDARERLLQLQKSQEAANATHARAVEQHEISKVRTLSHLHQSALTTRRPRWHTVAAPC
jgi:hypothetical protein